MRSRIEDVAAVAGVSIKTVSRVLNHEPNVREQTRERVLAAVARLGYKPNPSARSLAGQRSYALALVYNNPSRNYLMEIQSGMLDACHVQHYNLILGPVGTGRRTLPDLAALFENSRPDGVVLIPPLTDDEVVLSYLEEHEIPYACIAPRHPDGRIGVRMDETTAVVELIGRLVAQGHRRIGHIKGPRTHGACQWRHAGYRQALRAAGIAYDPTLVVNGQFSFESGLDAANVLLDLRDPPTAIFAANDDMAAAVYRVAGERGLRVPRDLSVCGFDDTPIAGHIYPALTTVRQPTSHMGRLATEQLIERIRADRAGRMITVEHTVLERESTAPPRKR
ncbi:LacI family DNA-binding transcriptional regulator [Stenotrophomonas geniculata]|jgi:LacI family transcriptional regulator|uniref:LacI family DNA-binding transcriptional regulator n=1 Tax=Stenotrophomonas geniculata TaxID=86188 RepID=UPI00066A8801|nr:LacI family DNA-binding transcriptional regulator [Stenotrophomonas geniculata]KPG69085.1 LacI family transcriptional regulator [Stenotrophomonas maltophilia]MBA0245328.1 LacI family DNA-binding transcriptional regulator [Stenotrophomonas maltophilia]MBA0249477.1 LacI family DNA-binding transcriptional regulator [Stenotrophomonas maltophilia]MBA0306619.1 LacI family DNA-binding transcriptional regulator [Stenotrophomonas maltophilia]MBA0438480.1 LacI family DNA-binding transcriptional regul